MFVNVADVVNWLVESAFRYRAWPVGGVLPAKVGVEVDKAERMRFSGTAFWVGWYHWYLGFGLHRTRRDQRDGLPSWQMFVGLGHSWAPRYCITWIGPFSYWHMHNAEGTEMTSGWNTTFERFDEDEQGEKIEALQDALTFTEEKRKQLDDFVRCAAGFSTEKIVATVDLFGDAEGSYVRATAKGREVMARYVAAITVSSIDSKDVLATGSDT